MSEIALQYFYPVFLSIVATLQIATAYNKLGGMGFFRHAVSAYLFAAFLIIPSGYLLFTWNRRNPYGVVEGPEQALLFLLATVCAFLLTIIVSSLVNSRRFHGHRPDKKGLEALREATFFQAIRYSLKGKS